MRIHTHTQSTVSLMKIAFSFEIFTVFVKLKGKYQKEKRLMTKWERSGRCELFFRKFPINVMPSWNDFHEWIRSQEWTCFIAHPRLRLSSPRIHYEFTFKCPESLSSRNLIISWDVHFLSSQPRKYLTKCQRQRGFNFMPIYIQIIFNGFQAKC